MIFRTQLPQRKVYNQVDYNSKLLLIGSCFSENIGNKLAYFKFQNNSNPFGILFHPKVIEKLITNSIHLKRYTDDDVFFLNERWHCYEAHSELSNPSKENLLHALNSAVNATSKHIHYSSHIVITLGTSWVYREISSDTIVANCHKVPQNKFLKELLTVAEISESLETITALIKNVNPTVQVIFTVSPVRHLIDGFVENARSKAHLISAIHQVISPENHIHYFPSFEIMMDDLRDYRFYKEDMIHPNETAITYIWEQFKKTWINDTAIIAMEEIDTIQKGLLHKPFNQNSAQHQKFLKSLKIKITLVQEKYDVIF
jgi:lysophospholipase L1-like esterase